MLVRRPHAPRRRGAALMLALLVLFVLVAVVFQISIGTGTDARVARNDVALTQMDSAIESALLECFEQLESDAESASSDPASTGGDPAAGAAAGLGALLGGGGAPGDPAAGGGSVDSRMDEWGRPQRTQIGDIDLRLYVQDENSKYNLLALLTKNEDEAQKAYDRLVRILDMCRQGTEEDIEPGRAEGMADAIREHLRKRGDSVLPRPKLVTDVEEIDQGEVGLPLSMREFVVLEPFKESDFRDFRDEEDKVVHSIASFLTVCTALETRESFEGKLSNASAAGGDSGSDADAAAADEGSGPAEDAQSGGGLDSGGSAGEIPSSGGPGGPVGLDGFTQSGGQVAGSQNAGSSTTGIAVNVNTAPVAVLKALFDDRDVPQRFWDEVVEYRNEEDEEAKKAREESGEDPPLDEFGKPILELKTFESLDKLSEMTGWENLEPVQQAEINQLLATESSVFTIYVTARKRPAGEDVDLSLYLDDPDEVRQREESGAYVTKTVCCTVWRRQSDDGPQIVPLLRWEVIDYVPFEIQDFPDEER